MVILNPKTVSLTGEEVKAVLVALNSRAAMLLQMTAKVDNYPMTEIDVLDDVIEKLREKTDE